MSGRNETFPEYLRRVGRDQDASGREFTAEDYRAAADRIEALEQAVDAIVHAFDLDDQSGFERSQRTALRAAKRARRLELPGVRGAM